MLKLFLIIIVFLVSRLVNINALPIFTDEASYWFSATKMAEDFVNNWDGSLVLPVAKPPLFLWFSAFLLKIGIDGILALRLLSVFSGLGLLIAIYFLVKKIFDERKAIIATLVYLLLPFALFYDRLGIMETLTVALLTFALLFQFKLLKNDSLKSAILMGVFLGLANLTKQSGQIGYVLIVFILPGWIFAEKINRKKLLKLISKTSVGILLGALITNILRFSKNFNEYTNFKPARLNDWSLANLSESLNNTFNNLTAIGSWLKSWLTLPIFVLLVTGILITILVFKRKAFYLLPIFVIPIVLQAVVATDLFPRYFLILIPAICLFISLTIFQFWELTSRLGAKGKTIHILFVCLLFVPVLNFNYKLLFDVKDAPFHYNERWQYISNWPAGYGVPEAAEIIKKASESQILVDGHNGHLKDSLIFYGIKPSSFTNVHRDDFEKEIANGNYEMVVANRPLDFEIKGYYKLKVFEKPYKETAIIIFKKVS